MRLVPGNLHLLTPSMFANLGLPLENHLNLEAKKHEILLMVDGLGVHQLREFEYLAQHLMTGELRDLTAGFPSTTVASLTSIGTGLVPGQHGMVGYTVKVPSSGNPGRLLNGLKWDERVDPLYWQPKPTLFEQASAAGISVAHIASARYEHTGFSEAALRGAQFYRADSFEEQVFQLSQILNSSPIFVYMYVNNLDVAGHTKGVGSPEWCAALKSIDNFVKSICEVLPKDSVLRITGDHGMINADEHILIDDQLAQGIDLIGGEPRARHLYMAKQNIEEVAFRWKEFLGERVTVLTRDESILLGYFDANSSDIAYERIGDLVVIAHQNLILVDPARVKEEAGMIGHHGGISNEERQVPLISFYSS